MLYGDGQERVKEIVQPKRGGQEGCKSIRPAFLHDRRYFVLHLKGYSHALNLNKPVSAFMA